MCAAAVSMRLVNSACRCPSRVLPARHDRVALCNLCVRVYSGNAGARTTSQSIDGGNAVQRLHRRELHELLTRASRALLAPYRRASRWYAPVRQAGRVRWASDVEREREIAVFTDFE